MSFLDAIIASSLRRASDGKVIFFPYGVLGRGFVVPSDEEYAKLRRP